MKVINPLSEKRIGQYWKCVNIRGHDDCWDWMLSVDKDGYGRFKINNVAYGAHRVSYYLATNIDPLDLQVCHSCDNERCVNPEHLFLGTTQDNTKDRDNKQRQMRGEKHPLSPFKESDIKQIRLLSSLGFSGAELGRKFGVTKESIYYIIQRKTWKHV